MASIVTEYFRIKNATDLIANVSTIPLYMFVGGYKQWTLRSSTDTIPPTPLDSTNETRRLVWDEILGGKRVKSENIVHMIRRIDWLSGRGYDQYDANDTQLFTRQFYVLTDEFKVFKCITRGIGNSTVKPTGDVSTISTGILSDGYEWKYMYSIDSNDALKFLTPSHMPVRNLTNGLLNKFTKSASLDPVSETGEIGHGIDAVRELGAYYAGINVRLEFNENLTLPVENEYRVIGLLQKPLSNLSTAFTSDRFRQTTLVTLNNPTAFILNSDSPFTANSSTGRIVEHSTTQLDRLYVHVETGTLSTGNTINVGGNTAVVQTVSNPELKKFSGDIIFTEYRRPIPRSSDQIESLTIIVEF